MKRLLLAVILLLPAALTARAAQLTTDDCLACHDDHARFKGSVHAPIDCTGCHSDVTTAPHEVKPKPVDCAQCHPETKAAYDSGLHARSRAGGNKNGATCLSCHGAVHEILPSSDPKSRTFRTNVPGTCASCHAVKMVMESAGLTPQPANSYSQSVHGRAVAQGSMKAAVCTDCHHAHDILRPNDQSSTIFRFNIPKTCGQCHAAIAKEFMSSIHGKAVARGNSQAPVCTDCHGIHAIRKHVDPTSSVAAQQIAGTTCGQCHGGVKLTNEFGVAGSRVSTYQSSYHGLARELGSNVAANCASCHGVHNILPSSDPKSTINKANLAKTCGKCHPGAGEKFTTGKVHLDANSKVPPTDTGSKIIRWIRQIYLVLIFATVGFMALHNLLIWLKKVRASLKDPERVVVRMNRTQRTQHFLLLTSFIVLVISGFALAWPQSVFAIFFGWSEAVRRIVHRIAAVVMLILGVYHIAYMLFTKEGRQGLKDFWFRLKDARDVVDTLKYYTGLSKLKPRLARFGYGEKIEYWAVVWGTFVMGLTGLMLWMEVDVSRLLPRWWVDVAVTIHFYEAILATLAIIIWHFYHVIFDPDVYPISGAWIDGKVTRHQYEEEHALAYEEWERERDAPPQTDSENDPDKE